jgi:hypothetical protein
MSHSRARTFDGTDWLRTLPPMLGALLATVLAVDMVLAFQPTWLDEFSRAWGSAVATRPVLNPVANALAASLVVASVVISSAVLLAFSRAVVLAPHVSILPAWIALCMLSVIRVHAPLPLPIPVPLFAGLSALLFVGASTALRSGSRASTIFGWMLVAVPLIVFGASYVNASHTEFPFGRDATLLLVGLLLSGLGVVLLAFVQPRALGGGDLDGIDAVEELFSQVERAERSEARVAELERQLSAYMRPQSGGSRTRSV